MSTRTVTAAQGLSSVRDRTLAGAVTLSVGLGLLFIVGFSPVSALHNAAHDTRHTAAFPCH